MLDCQARDFELKSQSRQQISIQALTQPNRNEFFLGLGSSMSGRKFQYEHVLLARRLCSVIAPSLELKTISNVLCDTNSTLSDYMSYKYAMYITPSRSRQLLVCYNQMTLPTKVASMWCTVTQARAVLMNGIKYATYGVQNRLWFIKLSLLT